MRDDLKIPPDHNLLWQSFPLLVQEASYELLESYAGACEGFEVRRMRSPNSEMHPWPITPRHRSAALLSSRVSVITQICVSQQPPSPLDDAGLHGLGFILTARFWKACAETLEPKTSFPAVNRMNLSSHLALLRTSFAPS